MRTANTYTLCLAGILVLSACDQSIRADVATGLADGQRLTAAQRVRLNAAQRGEVIVEDVPYFGGQVEARRGSQQGKPLPPAFEGARGITLAIDGKTDIRTIANAIEVATDIPVSIRTRYIIGAGDVIEVPIGTRMSARFEGPLSAFLDRISARMDVAWTYDGRAIAIDRMTTREWRIPLPFGATTVSDNAGGDAITIATERHLDAWAELETRLAPLAPPPARVTLAPEAGRVSVFGPPSVQRSVGKILEDVKATASTRIGIEVAVYFVDSSKADAFGLSLQNLGGTLGTFASRAVNLSATAFSSVDLSQGGGSLTLSRGTRAISFEALARSGAVVDYHLGSTTTQSGVIAPISLINRRNYLRSVQTTRDENGTSTELDVDVLETGIFITTLPRLIDRDMVQLSLTIVQNNLLELKEFTSNDIKIQQPDLDERTIRADTVLAPGEVLVVSGYEQERSVRSEQGIGFLRRIGLGGSNRVENRRVRMYVLIRPSLLSSRRSGGGRS